MRFARRSFARIGGQKQNLARRRFPHHELFGLLRITFKNMDIRDHHLGSMLKCLSQSFGRIIGLRDDLDIPLVFE